MKTAVACGVSSRASRSKLRSTRGLAMCANAAYRVWPCCSHHRLLVGREFRHGYPTKSLGTSAKRSIRRRCPPRPLHGGLCV